MREASSFDAVVFAGGGCRCFWQVGFYQAVAPALDLRPIQVAAVSAGSAMACALYADRVDEVLAYFLDRVTANEKNIYPGNLWGKAAVFPHEEIYRATILHAIDGAAMARLKQGPEIRVLMSRLPRWLGPRSGVAIGFLAYEVEKMLSPNVHPELARQFGFESEVVPFGGCETPGEIADVILQSSCTPPFTPVYHRDGEPVLDGGLVDNVPVSALSGGFENVLVLLTRCYPEEVLPNGADRTYVQPSEPVPVEKWDYASPDLVRATLELGRRDGEAFLEARARGRARAG